MPTVTTDRDAFLGLAADAPATARVPVEVHVAVDDPFLAYRRARDGDEACGVYLGTTGGQSGWGYFATTPARFEEVGPEDGSALAALDSFLDEERLVRGDCDVPYPCGAIGWLSYDVVRELEDLTDSAVTDRALPRLQIAAYDRIAAWEEPRDECEGGAEAEDGTEGADETTLRVTACPRLDEFESPGVAYAFGRQHALDLARRAVNGDPLVGEPRVQTDRATFESDCTREAYAERVRRVKEYVREGDTFQANVSQRLVAPAAVHPVDAFDALREVNPAPYSALVEFPGVDLVSASPELLLERDGEHLLTEPIAGTRPRGESADADEELEADLLADEKERAEHAMLVDLERNDLGKVSEFGSVDVPEYRRVDRYSEVMHLVSRVEGRLRDDRDLTDAIAAVFPGGTITGAPKPRTMEIIDELEATRRGPYTGSIGIFGFDGRATLNILIRTLVRYRSRYYLRVGAGIVHDSVPEREYEETLDKGRALINAVDAALDDRTELTVEGSE
ncbi:aminodeoxychorismate synthase, subunit I [Halomicrobium zhouii]|uniref:anthranilate synthase n=1 Tax=Halomicrobium zhouii TaxID=767519 RepID=A0A1I6LB93_9EURY|nr:anthranilate synthase component I family protein [Halomicrobium zhouii]SFS00735.1 aminodeoxychorismate synthase, subunit I [Halomicrobium zhouii]